MRYELIELRRLASAKRNGCEKHVRSASDLAAAGRFTEAAEHREAAKRLARAALMRSSEDPFSLNDHAVALADLGEQRQAIDLLQRARQLAPGDASILLNLAVILWRRGYWREAVRVAGTAHDLAPEDNGINGLLEKINGTLSVYDSCALDLQEASTQVPTGKIPRAKEATVPLHLLRMSLPQKPVGYSFRTHEILLAQKKLGLNPLAITDPFFPVDAGFEFCETDHFEGVVYNHLPAPAGFSAPPQEESPYFARETHLEEIRHPLGAYLTHYARELIEFSLRVQPHLLHSHSNHRNAMAASAAGSVLGLPHVYEVRGMWEESSVARGVLERSSDKYQLERRAETRCCEEANAVVTLSQTMKDDLVSRGIEAEKIFLVPNGVDPDRFGVRDHKCMRLARELKIGPGPVLGYAGSLSAYEGIGDLLRGFVRVRDVVPAAKLLIVGAGRDAERVHETATALQLGDALILTGSVDRAELADYYSLIDIFVVPRPPLRVCRIVTPLKPYEAMAAGRTVVVSDVPALREMIIEGQTAVSFKAGSPDSLAAVCVELCQTPDRRRELGANAARWVRSHRSWTAVAAGYFEAYEYAIDAHRAASKRGRSPVGTRHQAIDS